MQLHSTELLTLSLLSTLFAWPVAAEPVVLDYTGTATFVSGVFAGQGTEVTGMIHFDSEHVDSAGADPNRDEFRLSAGANQGFEMFMTVEVGNAMRTTEDNANPPFTIKNIQQFDGPIADIWFFEIPPDACFAHRAGRSRRSARLARRSVLTSRPCHR